jgi:hypothetical protein
VAGCKKIEGVVNVRVEPMNGQLLVRFDPRVTTREQVIVAVQAVVDRVEH